MEETHSGWVGDARQTVGGAQTSVRERIGYVWREVEGGASSQLSLERVMSVRSACGKLRESV